METQGHQWNQMVYMNVKGLETSHLCEKEDLTLEFHQIVVFEETW